MRVHVEMVKRVFIMTSDIVHNEPKSIELQRSVLTSIQTAEAEHLRR
jgi:hypothetical protein